MAFFVNKVAGSLSNTQAVLQSHITESITSAENWVARRRRKHPTFARAWDLFEANDPDFIRMIYDNVEEVFIKTAVRVIQEDLHHHDPWIRREAAKLVLGRRKIELPEN